MNDPLRHCAWLACRVLRRPAHERLGPAATSLGAPQQSVLLTASAVRSMRRTRSRVATSSGVLQTSDNGVPYQS